MNGHFARGRSGRPEIVLEEMYARLLADLCGQLVELVSPDEGGADPLAAELGLAGLGGDAPTAPDDPVLARLLPDAYPDDLDAAAEFRRYTEYDLRLRKRDNARTVLADLAKAHPGGRIVLDEHGAQAWLGALNDLRLALGTRLDVKEDMDEFADGLAEDDPRRGLFAVYYWLGIVQDSLVEALMG